MTAGKHHGSMTFSLAPRATFVENGQIVGFSALKVGDVVQVHYKEDGGGLQALNVDIQGTPRPPHGHHGHASGSR